MGSCNRTCAITNSIISPGDKVKLFFVVNHAPLYHSTGEYHHYQRARGVSCGVGEEFRLFGLPIDAEYDDYGYYSADETQDSWKYTLLALKKDFTSTPKPEDESYDSSAIYNVNPDTLTFESVQKLIRDGFCFLQSNETRTIRESVEIMAIHEDVYNHMVYNWHERDWEDKHYVFENAHNRIDNVVKDYFEKEKRYNELLKLKYDELESMVGIVNNNGEVITSEYIFEIAEMYARRESEFNMRVYNNTTEWCVRHYNMVDVFIKMYDNVTDESIEKFLRSTEEMKIMIRVMADNQLAIKPSSYARDADLLTQNASALANQAEILLNKSTASFGATYVPGYIELKRSVIEEYAKTHWAEDIKETLTELLKEMDNLTEDIMVKPQDKYYALSTLINDFNINVKIKIKE